MSDEYATDAEVLEAIDQGRKEAADKARRDLAKKASAEIMDKGGAPAPSVADTPPLKDGEYPIPDPPPDQLILAMERALRPLQGKLRDHNTLDRDAFDSEARERFAEEGIVIDIKWWYSEVPGVYIPEIEPYALTEAYDDDPDRQVHDVTQDVLGLGTKGVIGGPELWTP